MIGQQWPTREPYWRKYGVDLPDVFVETPKPGDPRVSCVQNLIVGSNRLAIDAAAKKARALGYRPLILSSFIEGETKDIASMHAAIAKEILANQPACTTACLHSLRRGTTCTVRGTGTGGRNQEFVLAAAIALAGNMESVVIFSAGTDGLDGPN